MANAPSGDLAARLAVLQQDYVAQLPQKLAAIEELWAAVAGGDWVPEPVHELHRLVHNLTGSGKTFGVSDISDAARELEQQLKAAVDAGVEPGGEARARMQRSLASLRTVVGGLRAPATALAAAAVDFGPRETPVAGNGRRLFLVEDDLELSGQLASQLGHYGYEVRQFSRLAGLQAAIAAERPAAVLMDEHLPDGSGFRVLQVLRDQGLAVPSVLLSSSGDMAVRLGAVRAGAAAFFPKPVEIGELVDRLDLLVDPRPAAPLRVLIVDDSVALSAFYGTVLEHSGMIVEVLHDPMRTLTVLDELGPDLILMDLYMPGCSGLELAAVIRQQRKYLSIPIVFLSTENDLGRQLAALGLGADDFLTKPIGAEHLLRAVQTRAERARALRQLMLHDSLTDVLNHTAVTERLEDEIARAERVGRPLALAVIDVDHFKSINDSCGHLVGDRVLCSMTRLLRQRLRKTDVVGRMGGEEFAVIMPDTAIDAGRAVLDAMRDSFAQVEHEAGPRRFRVTFSCGIASCSRGQSAQALIEAADGAMYRAKQSGRNRVVMAT